MALSEGNFAPQGTLDIPRDIFGCHKWWGTEVTVAARNHGAQDSCPLPAPLLSYLSSNANGTEAEKPCARGSRGPLKTPSQAFSLWMPLSGWCKAKESSPQSRRH